MPFTCEKIKIKDTEGLEILGYEGMAKHLSIPAEIDGMPVLSIGRHAFTDRNRGLEEVMLPQSIRVIRAFSFYFCSDVRRITLWDGVEDYYDGAIRTSAGISDIEIRMQNDRYELVRRILEDSDRRMRVLFRYAGQSLQLIFPDYNDTAIEDTRAQTFHFRIDGSGFSYRECVRNDGIRIREYDRLFQRSLSADDSEISLEIAVARLLYPAELSAETAEVYRAHLKTEMNRALQLAMRPENADWLELFTRERLLDEADLDLALRLVSERKMTAQAGLLMDYRQRFLKPRPKAALSLDDFGL